MRISPATASIVGETSANIWSQILSLPGMYILVELSDPDPDEAMARGNRLMTDLVEKLHEPPVGLAEVEVIVGDIVSRGASSVIMLSTVGKVAYLCQHGNCATYLKRDRMLARLVGGTGSISGELVAGDTLLLVTESVKNILDERQLTNSFDHLPASDLAEKLTLMLHEKIDRIYGAAFVFQVSGFAEEPVKPEEEPASGRRIRLPQTAFITRQHLVRIARRVRSRRWPSIGEIKTRFGNANSDSRQVIFTVAIIVSVLFLVSVFLGIRKITGTAVNAKVVAAMTDAQHAFDEGVALRDLNPLKSRERLQTAKQDLDPVMKQASVHSQTGRDLANLYKEINDNLTLVMQVYRVKPELFYDISLIKQGAKASYIAASDDTLVAVDTVGKAAYAVGISAKNGQLVAGGDYLDGAAFGDTDGNNLYVLAKSGVYILPLLGKPTKQPVIKTDDTWGPIGGFVTFGGNIYLLDTGKNRIWKYIAAGSGFGDRKEYLTPDTLPDFSQATDLAIDGSVWIGTAGGKILKFTGGLPQTFETQGIDPALGNKLVVDTADDMNNLYILDTAGKRVVVTDKNGVYIAQYVWSGNMGVTGFTVSEKDKKVLLLSGGLIYSIDLK
jgi:hypothetical protein